MTLPRVPATVADVLLKALCAQYRTLALKGARGCAREELAERIDATDAAFRLMNPTLAADVLDAKKGTER